MSNRNPTSGPADPLVASTARGASILVLLQIGSRVLTFLANQVLLRYLSPELLGISAQLELLSITILYFSRESIRVALQRQGDDAGNEQGPRKKAAAKHGRMLLLESTEGKSQSLVNLAWLAIAVGPLSAGVFYLLYKLSLAASVVRIVPDILPSAQIVTLAALIELASEPCFVIVQQKSLYRYRAAAETAASLLRCGATCGAVIFLHNDQQPIGAAPFAYGQLAYAVALTLIYHVLVNAIANRDGFSLQPQELSTKDPQQLLYGVLHRPQVSLAGSMYLQAGVKHLLTQGDALLVASLCSLETQGIYAIASNYGGLIARVILQPIEESCRNLFGKLLNQSVLREEQTANDEERLAIEEERKFLRQVQLHSAKLLLLDLLRGYGIISVLAGAFGPTLFPLAVKLLIGSRWATPSALEVLSTYVYYMPLLAVNGVTEAFVTSVASPTELQRQSLVMISLSGVFALSGWGLLYLLDLGAQGLIWANVITMAARIGWTSDFIQRWFVKEGSEIAFYDSLPRVLTISGAMLGASAMRHTGSNSSARGLVQIAGLTGVVSLLILFTEQAFLADLIRRRIEPPKDDKPKRIVHPLAEMLPPDPIKVY